MGGIGEVVVTEKKIKKRLDFSNKVLYNRSMRERAIVTEKSMSQERATLGKKPSREERAMISKKPRTNKRATFPKKPNEKERATVHEKPTILERAVIAEKSMNRERYLKTKDSMKENWQFLQNKTLRMPTTARCRINACRGCSYLETDTFCLHPVSIINYVVSSQHKTVPTILTHLHHIPFAGILKGES